MKLHLLMFLIFVKEFGEGESELLTNRTYSRSRYSWRNRISSTTTTSTTEAPQEVTTENDEISIETTTLAPSEPMEIVVESQTVEIRETKPNKFEREVLSDELSDFTLRCGDRFYKDVPWIAVIVHKDPSGRDSRRTLSKGVIISSRHVLTTVSSIHNSHPYWVATHVRLGDHPTWMNSNLIRDRSKIITVEIKKVFQHSGKDIAILQLAETISFGDSIQPACLPVNEQFDNSDLYLHICKKTHSKHKPKIDLVHVTTLSPHDCSTMFQKKGATLSDGEFCAWDEYGDTCTGDIGGPLLAKVYGKYMVVGLNSFALTDKEFDATDYPGVYVNVGHYIKWIDDIIKMKEY